jgi:hypothetical protein
LSRSTSVLGRVMAGVVAGPEARVEGGAPVLNGRSVDQAFPRDRFRSRKMFESRLGAEHRR